MIIQCTNCNRKFRVEDDRIRPPGAKVRCSKCGEIFYVEKHDESDDRDLQLEFGGKNPFDDTSPLDGDQADVFDADSLANMIQDDILGSREVAVDDDEEDEPDASDIIREENLTTGKDNGSKKYVDELKENEDQQAGGSAQSYQDQGTSENYDRDEHRDAFKPFGGELSVDRDALKSTYPRPKHSSGSRAGTDFQPSPEFKSTRKNKSVLGKLFVSFFVLFIVVALLVSGSYLLSEFGVIPEEDFSRYKNTVLSLISSSPGSSVGDKELVITDLTEKWVDSRYGQVFMVSGKVINNSGKTVNHIKLKSEFYSVEDKLYEMDFYAGNTLTERDVKNMPVESIRDRLERKSGDINYNNIDKLAGLNFDIKPGESVPFYTVFPSRSRILGLNYNISVVNYTTGGS